MLERFRDAEFMEHRNVRAISRCVTQSAKVTRGFVWATAVNFWL